MKKVFMFALLLFILTGCANEEGTITKVNCDKMKELMKDSKTVLLDVRSKEEYEESHLDKAENRPLTKIDELDINKKTPIIVYCKSGVRSNEAAKMLLEIGYINIYDLGAMSNCN